MPHKSEFSTLPHQLTGEGHKVITLLNGFMRPQRDFQSLRTALNRQGFKVLTLDFRGSGTHRTHQPFSITDLADDVIKLWRDLEVHSTALLGISMGGVVAQSILSKYDKPTITHTMLVSTTRSREDLQKPSPNWSEGSHEILKNYVSSEFAERHDILLKAMGKAMDKTWAEHETRIAAEFQRLALQQWYPEPIDDIDPRRCLVLHGDQDQIIPFSSGSSLAHHLNANIKTMQGHGHLLIAECPDILRQEILNFLND